MFEGKEVFLLAFGDGLAHPVFKQLKDHYQNSEFSGLKSVKKTCYLCFTLRIKFF